MSKRPTWRIDVQQLSEEKIVSRWANFWGEEDNDSAWFASFFLIEAGASAHRYHAWGRTREEALENARSRIAIFDARTDLVESTRKVYYV